MTLVGGVVLAAGEATRFGSAKQRLLLPDVLTRLREAGISQVVVVAGAYELELPEITIVDCSDWAAGPGASLRAGLAALPPHVDAAVVVLADGPDLAPAAVQRVIADWRKHGGEIVAASYEGARGHPLLVTRSAWHDVPDEGLRSRPARLVPCDDLGAPGDVDTPDDLAARHR